MLLVRDYLKKKVNSIPKSLYLPGMAPCEILMFPELKLALRRKRFETIKVENSPTKSILKKKKRISSLMVNIYTLRFIFEQKILPVLKLTVFTNSIWVNWMRNRQRFFHHGELLATFSVEWVAFQALQPISLLCFPQPLDEFLRCCIAPKNRESYTFINDVWN